MKYILCNKHFIIIINDLFFNKKYLVIIIKGIATRAVFLQKYVSQEKLSCTIELPNFVNFFYLFKGREQFASRIKARFYKL